MAQLQSVSTPTEFSIDELASRAALPSRTIREYQTMGLLPPPQRQGRVGVYSPAHLQRLELIARLQQRGYSLAGVRDLLASWRDGAELSDVLGLSADQLVQVDEPGAPASLDQLAKVLPQLVPSRLSDLLAVGVVDNCGPDRYCVPSPSLLQLAVDVLAAGYTPDDALTLFRTIHDAASAVAKSAGALLARPPSDASSAAFAQLTTRGRGLLAHGTGRMTIYELGRELGSNRPPSRKAPR